MYIQRNNNPLRKTVGDCVIRSISTVTGLSWNEVFTSLMVEGYTLKDMPNSNYVWGELLRKWGFERRSIPNTCPRCYTVRDFCRDHPEGRFILATGTHAVAVVSGNYIDTWDSGDQVPVYYWEPKEVIDAV